jgi:hypothetical protein
LSNITAEAFTKPGSIWRCGSSALAIRQPRCLELADKFVVELQEENRDDLEAKFP